MGLHRYQNLGSDVRGRGLLHADDDLNARVATWRRQRMNWAAIARNLGRSEPDVRREFGPAPERRGQEAPPPRSDAPVAASTQGTKP